MWWWWASKTRVKMTLVVRDTLAYSSYESTHKKLVVVWIRKPLALCVPLTRKSAKKTASNTSGTHKKP